MFVTVFFFFIVFGDCSGKEELGPIAAMKIAQLTNELQASSAPYPVERMKTGFEHFKKEKYE